MASTLQVGYPEVPRSITNPSVSKQDAVDVNGPMSFLTFIKLGNVSYEPETLQSYYNYYLKNWNILNVSKNVDETTLIIDEYRSFLKEISLNYTTPEEKIFLSKIDFNDPLDLDIALGFYSRKLKEICDTYNSKRHELKFGVVKSKLKGSNIGVTRHITELVLSYLKTREDNQMEYDWSKIQRDLEVEVEELYDVYTKYYNQTPNSLIYDNKDLDFGINIFLNDNNSIISDVFSNFSQELIELKELDNLLDNKRKLNSKYMAFPMYFIQTGTTTSDILSGKLFDVDNTVKNFSNVDYPTTASTQQPEFLLTKEEKGFFRPFNTTIVLVDGLNYSFSINNSNLSPNSLYVFPDPAITGKSGDVMTFVVNDSFLKKNYSSGLSNNLPSTNTFDTKYYGYVSKIEPNERKYLNNIFNNGWVKDSKKDIYNNIWGLFINDGRFEKTIHTTSTPTITSVVFDGWEFFDTIFDEGFNFDYTTSTSSYSELIRSGLSLSSGTFDNNLVPDLILDYGSFEHNYTLPEFSEAGLKTEYQLLEHGYFASSFTDYTSYECASSFYTFGNSLTGFEIIDGGHFTTTFPDEIVGYDNYHFDSTIYNNTELDTTTLSTVNGALLVRNTYTKDVLPILEALPYLSIKLNNDIITQIEDKVVSFDVVSDILVLETENYLTISQIKFENGYFQNPNPAIYTQEHTSGNFDKISNRVRNKFDIIFCKFITTEPISSNNFILYPEIYKYNTTSRTIETLYPISTSDTSFFNVSGGNVRYISADAPIITYNSKTNSYNISLGLRDSNDSLTIHNYPFYLNPNVTFDVPQKLQLTPLEYSNIFGTSTLTWFLSSNTPSTLEEELIL